MRISETCWISSAGVSGVALSFEGGGTPPRVKSGALHKRKAADQWQPQWVMDIVVALLTCVHEAVQPYLDRAFHGLGTRPRSSTRAGRGHWLQQTSAWALQAFLQEFTVSIEEAWRRRSFDWDLVEKAKKVMSVFVTEAGKGKQGRR
ncbi:MAG: hypothetical protein GY772_27995, partial [bacterium]|nr:hypothetical protein [bacterium]